MKDDLIRKTFDLDGNGVIDDTEHYFYFNGQITAIVRDNDGLLTGTNSELTHRFFYTPAVDELVAVDTYVGGTTTSYWALPDHTGTVRHLLNTDGSLAHELNYTSFGDLVAITDQVDGGTALTDVQTTDLLNDIRMTYTGRLYDTHAALYNYRARWYDSQVGKFISEDPLSFAAGDVR